MSQLPIVIIDSDQRQLDQVLSALRNQMPDADVQGFNDVKIGFKAIQSRPKADPPALLLIGVRQDDAPSQGLVKYLQKNGKSYPVLAMISLPPEDKQVTSWLKQVLDLGADDILVMPFVDAVLKSKTLTAIAGRYQSDLKFAGKPESSLAPFDLTFDCQVVAISETEIDVRARVLPEVQTRVKIRLGDQTLIMPVTSNLPGKIKTPNGVIFGFQLGFTDDRGPEKERWVRKYILGLQQAAKAGS